MANKNITNGNFTSTGRDSVVGIATRYGMDGLGIEPYWVRNVLRSYIKALGPPSLLYRRYRVIPGDRTVET
jgi:hypothetical protein